MRGTDVKCFYLKGYLWAVNLMSSLVKEDPQSFTLGGMKQLRNCVNLAVWGPADVFGKSIWDAGVSQQQLKQVIAWR